VTRDGAAGGTAVGRRPPSDSTGSVRVYLCDDAEDYRALLRVVLGGEDDLDVVGEASDGRACLEGVTQAEPDVVLLDLNMPGMDGFEALPLLRRAIPRAKVLVLSTGGAADCEQQAVELGAAAYIEKPSDVFELPATIRAKLAAAA
jgi:DNA-binding NarL/FixJ family response regulator